MKFKNILVVGFLGAVVQTFAGGQNGEVARNSQEVRRYLAATSALARLRLEGNASPQELAAAQARVAEARVALDALRAAQGIERMAIPQDNRNR